MPIDPNNPNDVFPRLPIGGDNYSLFDKFRNDILPLRRQGAVDDIGSRLAQPVMHQEPQQTRASFADNSPLRPGYTPPNLGVVYKPPMSDQIATQMLGVGPGAVTPADEAANKLKSQAIGATEADKNVKNDIAEQKVGISQQRANVYDFKARNPGNKYQVNKANGHLEAINPITNQVIDLGQNQIGEQDLIDLNQKNDLAKIGAQGKNAESLQEMKDRHATELANLNNTAKAAGKTTTTSVTDAEGKNMGTRTTSTKTDSGPAYTEKDGIRTYKNGNKAKFDGKGWVLIPSGK